MKASTPSYDLSLDEMKFTLRQEMAFSIPRVVKPRADTHARMAERWGEHARELGRPAYHEAGGFTTDRFQLDGATGRSRSLSGREKPYGPFSRPFWRYVGLSMREAFLAAIHRELGTTTTQLAGQRSMSIVGTPMFA